MKILVLTQNVKDIDSMKQGLNKAQSLLANIGLNVFFDYLETTRQFTSIPLNTDTVHGGYEVNPDEILLETKSGYDVTLLTYDWNFQFPHPTNPCTNYSKSLTDVPMQIPVNFYSNLTVNPIITYPDVLTQFFLHEFSHYIADEAGVTDLTHYQYQFSQFSQKSPTDYYLYLIKQNMTNTVIVTTLNAQNAPVTRSIVRIGSTGPDVIYLQQKLNLTQDGDFGPITQKAVEMFQSAHGLVTDGIVGPKTWLALTPTQSSPAPSKIDLWCEAAKEREGWIAPCAQYPNGTTSYQNNNPGNLNWTNQPHAVQNGRWAKFDTYDDGYAALRELIVRACTGGSHIYNANGNLYDFYNLYAPSSDSNDPNSYAEFVASRIGVPATTIIKTLV